MVYRPWFWLLKSKNVFCFLKRRGHYFVSHESIHKVNMRRLRKLCVFVCVSILYLVNRLVRRTDLGTDWSGTTFGFPEDSDRVWRTGRTAGGQTFVIGDTACPRNTKIDQSRSHRPPDVIALGVPKAGTTTLSFLDCHERIFHFFKNSETVVWKSQKASSDIPKLRAWRVSV